MTMSLGQYFHVTETRLSINREENNDRIDSNRKRKRSGIEEKAENKNCRAEGIVKNSISENSEENFELTVKLIRT